MKIAKIEFFKAHIKLKKPFITSLGRREFTTSIFIKITTQKGLTGWGECCPFPPILGETPETCFIVGKLLAERLIGDDPCDIEKICSKMDKVIFSNTAIKSAIELACQDLRAKEAGVPVYKQLGGSIDKTIKTDFTISLDTVDAMVEDAVSQVARGFTTLKIKMGDGWKTDIKRLLAIREAVGPRIDLRIDANQGWERDDAIEVLNKVAGLNIQYCEEPINKRRYFELKKVINNSPVKIMADECLLDHIDAQKLIRGGYCDYFNIKLGKSGGIYKAQKILKLSEKYGILTQVGGFVESRLVFTANCHLAYTSPQVKFFDFDSPLFHEFDPIIGGMKYHDNWEITIPDSPGFGMEVDPSFLKECESLRIE